MKTNLENILFDVEKTKVTEYACNTDYQYDIFGYPNGVKTRLNSCSKRYELVPNSEIFPKVRQILLTHGLEFTETYTHINNARFYATYVIENKELAYGVLGSNDVVKPTLNVQHSYNGLTKYKIVFGYFRLVCGNGLTIPVKEMNTYNLSLTGKHTKSILESLNKLDYTLNYFGDNKLQIGLAITAKFDQLANQTVNNWSERVIEVLEKNKVNIIDNSKFNTINYIGGVIDSEKHLYNNQVNDWLIYNAINAYINDDNLNIKAPEVRREKDQAIMESLLTVN